MALERELCSAGGPSEAVTSFYCASVTP
ncbi:hypothetical protein MY10362_005439, partial [Beauveria mimosiformis]